MTDPAPDPATESSLQNWIGHSEHATDWVDPWAVNALAATLDLGGPPLLEGDCLPAGWHWILFRPAVAARDLGVDGHPRRGGFLPPVVLPRRMWAGGRLRFIRPLRVGESVSRVSTVRAVESKVGKSGKLMFVTVAHAIAGEDGPALYEEQDLVYREAPQSGHVSPPPPVAPDDSRWSRRTQADSTLLFRYSALTFNGHRIHYDVDYCRTVEGYSGLVVHGPLLATWLLGLAVEAMPDHRVSHFSYRGRSPAFHHQALRLCARPEGDRALALWSCTDEGVWVTDASATLDPLA